MGQIESVTVANFVARTLKNAGIDTAFNLTGGMIVFLLDALASVGGIQVISNRHEQASGFAAEGFARTRTSPSIALATSGPGATNLITAIGSCYFDSTPVLFITGQVNTQELRTNPNQRQQGFQELDIVSMVAGVTKYAVRVKRASEVPQLLATAWESMLSGRKGPVLVDIPIDIQQELIDWEDLNLSCRVVQPADLFDELSQQKTIEILETAKRPIVIAGGGIRQSGSLEKYAEFISRTGIPAVHSLMGVDTLGYEVDQRVGMLGSYGNRWANWAVENADVVLVLGSRLDVRQIGVGNQLLLNKKIIRVEIDAFEINERVQAELTLNVDLNEFLDKINKLKLNMPDFQEWTESIKQKENEHPQQQEQTEDVLLNPSWAMEQLSKHLGGVNGYLVDVGQHQMWAAQSININANQRFITSGGMGAMGFSLPAAVGAAIAQEGPWVVVLGDGCFQLSSAELQTVVELGLPLIVIVVNNNQLGMVAQFQETNTPGRYQSTREGYSVPNLVAIAKAYGINAIQIATSEDFAKLAGLDLTVANLIELKIDPLAKALPKMGATKHND